MLSIILSACILVAVTLVVHAAGITGLLMALRKWHALSPTRFGPIIRLLLNVTFCLILFHLAEISVWGWFYHWRGCLPDAETAFYFSGVTYTTVGYGELVLTKPWRLLAPIEALTGILMCGLSASFFFAVVVGIDQARHPTITGGSTTEGKGT